MKFMVRRVSWQLPGGARDVRRGSWQLPGGARDVRRGSWQLTGGARKAREGVGDGKEQGLGGWWAYIAGDGVFGYERFAGFFCKEMAGGWGWMNCQE